MKVAPTSLGKLKPFAGLNDFFMVIPPRRFVIFGEGKRAVFRGIAVEGFLNENFTEPMAYSFEAFLEERYEPAVLDYDPLAKIDDFDDLITATVKTTFLLSAHAIKEIRKRDARKFTHVRFFKKPSGVTTARVFDARKYFSSQISDSQVDDYDEIEMRTDATADFYFYVELTILKKLPIDDYDVIVSDNEMVTFEGHENGLVFHLRDQRLGEQMETRISDLNAYDEVFFLDIDRVKPSSADWKNPNSKRRTK